MKYISIITIIDNNNFGTFLQAFALCKSIENLGHKPVLADYCRPHMKPLKSWWKMCLEVRNPLRILSRSRGSIRSYILHSKDRKFISCYLSSKTCYSVEELKKSLEPADVYMTGSDQVWNSIHNQSIDRAFFLDYAPKEAKKVAYAASIGKAELEEWEKIETQRLLLKYSHITLREQSALEILGSLGIEESKMSVVLDPTLLLTKLEWAKNIKLPRLCKERYLLVYSVETKEQDAIIDAVACKVAKDLNLKIVGIYYGSKYNRINCCNKNYYWATPSEFLSLMYHADFVVVSSFHGTAFSINFEKDFYTVMPNRFNSRIANILNITNLNSRLIQTKQQIPYITNYRIDWTRVREIIKLEREKSTNILSNIIEK